MYGARVTLERALTEYERTGVLPPPESYSRVRVFTNKVTVGGVDYYCALALDWRSLSSSGFLAISTNRTALWVDKERKPKVIDKNYRSPFFGGGI